MADTTRKEISVPVQDPSEVALIEESSNSGVAGKDKMTTGIPDDGIDDASTVVSENQDDDKKSDKKPPAKKAVKIRRDVQEKIMAYMGQELQTGRTDMSKQEVAEGCGFAKAGAHSFHYAWRDLEQNAKWLAKSGKGVFRLTDIGKDHIPSGIILICKKQDNNGKQEAFRKTLLKQCKEAKDDKMVIVFDILSDGKPHSIVELGDGLNLTRQGVTKHLHVLREAGMVSCKRGGRESRYKIRPAPIRNARDYLTRASAQWDEALGRLKASVERQ